MKNKFLIILLAFAVILAIVAFTIYNYRKSTIEAQKINNEYKSYYNTQILGTDLISIINKTIDYNERNKVNKNDEGLYIENNVDSIKIHIKFKYKDDYKTIEMEQIAKNGTENFIKAYSTASFKCTDIEFHNKNKNVKELTFIETDD